MSDQQDIMTPSGPIVIAGPRLTGKTTRLIELAHETDQYIIEPNRFMADYVFRMADRMGKPIRNPISVAELATSQLDRTPYAMFHPGGGVLVDEASEVLRMCLNLPRIDAMVVCARGMEWHNQKPSWWNEGGGLE